MTELLGVVVIAALAYWFGGRERRRLFGGREEARSEEPEVGGPRTERLIDVPNLGLSEVEATDLSPAFKAQLTEACIADPNIARLSLLWMSSGSAERELLALLALDRNVDQSVHGFLQRVNALGGPSCVVSVPEGTPKPKPFYQRG